MQKQSNILSGTTDGICTITINRPEKQNALTQTMYNDLITSFQEAAEDDLVMVVILAGAGEHFTAGNDIGDFLNAEGPFDENGAVRWLKALHNFEKPIIATVSGNAIGIGTTCLFHCDLVVADTTTKFCMPFTALALCPEAGASQFLPQMVGHQKASQFLLLGETFSAEEALTMNMINHCVAPEERTEVTQAMAEKLSRLPAESVRISKALLKTPVEAISDRMSREFKLFEQQMKSDTARKIFEKFLNK